jgi:hypothetical protein
VSYTQLFGQILDTINGSEDARLIIEAMVAGTSTPILSIGPGVIVGVNGSDKGVGALNADGLYVGGHGVIAQTLISSTSTSSTSSATIPFDDTIPQNTEGVEILSQAITPINANSTILITADVHLGSSAAAVPAIAALFVDSATNALAARSQFCSSLEGCSMTLRYAVAAVNTSSRTYKLRVGLGTGTVTICGDSGGRIFGGVSICSLTVQEVLPQ